MPSLVSQSGKPRQGLCAPALRPATEENDALRSF
jgi:hypothetical protein